MKTKTTYQNLALSIAMLLLVTMTNGQGIYTPTDATDKSVLAYTFLAGSFQSDTITQGDTITLLATPTTASITPQDQLSYQWTPNTKILAKDANAARVAPLETTVYTITVTAPNSLAESMEVEIVVQVPIVFSVPQSFTPNGDGIDDRFTLSNADNVKVKTFKVFDRWGTLLFDNEDTNGWDGSHKRKEMPSGVYIYVILVELPDGTEDTREGQLYLIRD